MNNSITFTGDGQTTVFYFTFPFFGVNDVHVTVDGIIQTTDVYTMTPTPTPNDADTEYTGGTIEFNNAPSAGQSIKIYRDIELVRHIDYQPTLQPQSYQLNQDFNQCIGALQELKAKIQNAIGMANIPTVADLLTELTTIRTALPNLLDQDDLDTLNDTIDDIQDALTALNGYDYVVESQLPTADNNYTWYRKYKSGWVEQGGRITLNGPISASNKRITFPVKMSDTKYTACVHLNANAGMQAVYVGWEGTAGMSVGTASASSTGQTTWYVCGTASNE